MNNQTLKQLKELPIFEELAGYLAQKAIELDSIRNLPEGNPEEIALEAKARQKAFDKLSEILAPLVDVEKHRPSNPKEYVA